MKKLIPLIALLLTLSSCSYLSIHKTPIEQGNIITDEMVSKIHTGMTRAQVEAVMGRPVLLNTFANDRIDYVYTFKPAGKQATEKYFTLIFRNGRLQDIKGNMYSQYNM